MNDVWLSAWTSITELVPVNVLDIPRAYTALAEWLACMVYAQQFRHRLSKRNYYLLSAFWLVLQIAFLTLTDELPLLLWIPCMIGAVGLMLALLLLTC